LFTHSITKRVRAGKGKVKREDGEGKDRKRRTEWEMGWGKDR
jgi:hypothetical protein